MRSLDIDRPTKVRFFLVFISRAPRTPPLSGAKLFFRVKPVPHLLSIRRPSSEHFSGGGDAPLNGRLSVKVTRSRAGDLVWSYSSPSPARKSFSLFL
ncbi:hypothetical protein F2Q68_00006638 [Brassica cretica]|uniref:Uncharacterized protein n=1 Tax=Brassica cretica TaxID=69181 RepID=A0A8S9JES0_BRACR|nr:hypothetical protein F2Q68_00006638 [Brassica cretica]